VSARKAVEENIVASELLTYQLCLARSFLMELGLSEDVLRFRQHMSTEMAHYAIDCWDVEVYTDRYGWIEVIGIADRTDFDLKSHSDYSKEDLRVFLEYPEPHTVKKMAVKANMGKFGPLFKGDAPKILRALEDIDAEAIIHALDEEGAFQLELEGGLYNITQDLVSFQQVEETVRGEKIYPHVIEPSYGIDRIVYSVLLHSYVQEKDRTFFKLPAEVAPVEVNIFPLVNREELISVTLQILDDLRKAGIIAEKDTSGTIGRRYARSDEIGVPFAVTVDHQTQDDNTVTIRERNSQKQVRITIKDLILTLQLLLSGKKEFLEYETRK
jgi:glycyl-tRNA synthetase